MGCFSVEQSRLGRKNLPEKRKAGASSRTPNAVIYNINYSTGYGNVKRK
jgi:hypothetical protein